MKRIWTGAVITAILVVAFLLREVNLFLFDICILNILRICTASDKKDLSKIAAAIALIKSKE